MTFTPDEHDEAVARTSHLPHLLAALVAGRLTEAPPAHLALSGQGVRDVTRIAAGDPGLWQQVITANTMALTGLLHAVRDDVDTLLQALSDGDRELLAGCWTEVSRGRPSSPASTVARPARRPRCSSPYRTTRASWPGCWQTRGDRREHRGPAHRPRPGRAYGLVELSVAADSVDHLLGSPEGRGWTTHR